jgi:oligopeptide/dipeptide ABC transporter ATP-binding protein
MTPAGQPVLEVQDLRVTFATPREQLQAVCGVSFAVRAGEIFGIVGESGCGKSVTGLSILRMVPPPGQITGGDIRFGGASLADKSAREMQQIRGASIAMIFQDPTSSLNPVFQIGSQLVDVLRQHRPIKRADARAQVLSAFESVGLPDGQRVYRAYPHELSGGMQQRVMIAMALLCSPALLIADEPTTALDVTIQAQILWLLRDLRDRTGIAILLITHDLGVVREVCDRVAVMYAGQIVESCPTEALFRSPRHPYTQGLIAATPSAAARGQHLQAIPGVVPANPGRITGCPFSSRCAHVMDRCRVQMPPVHSVSEGHAAACYLLEDAPQS